MLKTFCIKSNDKIINNYIIKHIKNFKLDNLYLSVLDFSLYTNIILHYNGNDVQKLITKLTNLLTNITITFYSKYIIKSLINANYFYFSEFDKSRILDYCMDNIKEKGFSIRQKKIIKNCFKKHFLYNKKIILEGFIRFSLKKYIEELDIIIDQSVDNYIIEKEYLEFVDLLRCYVNSKEESIGRVYLIYHNENSILLNNDKELIPITNSIDKKYLSDITFSKNDYCLNTLLTILPKEIIICNNNEKDEFLRTLELIFQERIRFENRDSSDFQLSKI